MTITTGDSAEVITTDAHGAPGSAGRPMRITVIGTGYLGAVHAVELAWNPEFLREGFAVQDTLAPDRMRHARLIDARNTVDARRWQDAGWTIRALGRTPLDA